MHPKLLSLIVSIFFLPISGLATFSSSVLAAGSRPPASAAAESNVQMSQEELQSAVISFANRFEPKDPAISSKPFDISEYIVAIEKIQATLESLNQIGLAIDKESTPLITQMLKEFNKAADERVDHIFLRLFQLLAATGVII